jgi:hypothetical protein
MPEKSAQPSFIYVEHYYSGGGLIGQDLQDLQDNQASKIL